MKWKLHSESNFDKVIATYFGHATTVILSWHVQKGLQYDHQEINDNRISIEFELRWKIVSEMGSVSTFSHWLATWIAIGALDTASLSPPSRVYVGKYHVALSSPG